MPETKTKYLLYKDWLYMWLFSTNCKAVSKFAKENGCSIKTEVNWVIVDPIW